MDATRCIIVHLAATQSLQHTISDPSIPLWYYGIVIGVIAVILVQVYFFPNGLQHCIPSLPIAPCFAANSLWICFFGGSFISPSFLTGRHTSPILQSTYPHFMMYLSHYQYAILLVPTRFASLLASRADSGDVSNDLPTGKQTINLWSSISKGKTASLPGTRKSPSHG